MNDLQAHLKDCASLVDSSLQARLVTPADGEAVLYEAMRYSLFAGGKRLRPVLCLTVADAIGVSRRSVLPAACALEMIHTYSLIHDDLPAMDNDDFRRGKPTSHKVFGDAIALLAGDALLTQAFNVLLDTDAAPECVISMQRELTRAAGPLGMVGGQVGDMNASTWPVPQSTLTSIHARKTGALLSASARLPVLAAGGNPAVLAAVSAYAQNIGLAFQIQDDILDVTGDERVLGKATGADADRGKATFPRLLGIERSSALVHELTEAAIAAIAGIPGLDDQMLGSLARYLGHRDR